MSVIMISMVSVRRRGGGKCFTFIYLSAAVYRRPEINQRINVNRDVGRRRVALKPPVRHRASTIINYTRPVVSYRYACSENSLERRCDTADAHRNGITYPMVLDTAVQRGLWRAL